jgi:tRNA (guanine37-N1)-methyltransferase
LECPHYTRPPVWHNKEVPEVLQSGHHANIEEWRFQASLERTRQKRPDMYEAYIKEHPEVLEPKKKRKPVRIKEKTMPSNPNKK